MAEMTTASSFVVFPKGPYSLAASIRYLEGFAPAAYDSESSANLEMAFCVDGYWDPVAVRVHEEAGAVHGTIYGVTRLPQRSSRRQSSRSSGSSRSTSMVEAFRTSLVTTQLSLNSSRGIQASAPSASGRPTKPQPGR